MLPMLLLLVVDCCLLALAIFRVVTLNRLVARQASTIQALRDEVALGNTVVDTQADIIEYQAGELKDLRDCFDGMTDLCMASLSAIR